MLAIAERPTTIKRVQIERTTRTARTARTARTEPVVVPEGSPLAAALRAEGWVARAGWRTGASMRAAEPVWMVRLAPPASREA